MIIVMDIPDIENSEQTVQFIEFMRDVLAGALMGIDTEPAHLGVMLPLTPTVITGLAVMGFEDQGAYQLPLHDESFWITVDPGSL